MMQLQIHTLVQMARSLTGVFDRLLRPIRFLLQRELPRKYRKWKSRYGAGAPQRIELPLEPSLLKKVLESPEGRALLSLDARTGKPRLHLFPEGATKSLLAIRYDKPPRRFRTDFLSMLSGSYLEESRIRRSLSMARHIQFLVWSEGREPGQFPSLDPWNFRSPPSAGRVVKSVYDRLHETGLRQPDDGAMPDCRFTHGMEGIYALPSMHRMRRVLMVPLEAKREDASRLLPPPFHMEPGGPVVQLHLIAALAGGYRDPTGDSFADRGRERGIFLQLLLPATLMDRSGERKGWIPLHSVVSRRRETRLPFPRQTRRILFDLQPGTMELELLDENGLSLFREAYTPFRAFHRKDPLPGFLGDSRRLFLQEREGLDICVLEEKALFPANHLHIFRRTAATTISGSGTKISRRKAPHPPRVAGPGDSAAYFSNLLGIPLVSTGQALFLSRLDYEFRSLERSPFLEAIYRLPPARTESVPVRHFASD